MERVLLLFLFQCGPALLVTAALAKTISLYRKAQLSSFPMLMVGGAWLVSVYPALFFLRGTLMPPAGSPPPWEDSETLSLGMLFLLAPIGLGFTVAAGIGGASRWVVIALVIAMFILFALGVLEAISV